METPGSKSVAPPGARGLMRCWGPSRPGRWTGQGVVVGAGDALCRPRPRSRLETSSNCHFLPSRPFLAASSWLRSAVPSHPHSTVLNYWVAALLRSEKAT